MRSEDAERHVFGTLTDKVIATGRALFMFNAEGKPPPATSYGRPNREHGRSKMSNADGNEKPTTASLLAGLDRALTDLPADKSPGLTIISALKGVWAHARQEARQVNRERGGPAAARVLLETNEGVLRRLLDFSAQRAGFRQGCPGVALLAMGSYGRGEPVPYSDLDLLVLYQHMERERMETLTGLLFRPLWDAGLTLGHAVRTPSDCLEKLEGHDEDENALESATALLEARFIAGDAVLANLFLKRDLPDFFRRRGRPFVEAKIEEASSRHRRQGDSVYRTQPNLKDSPGALRDYQLALWIDRASHLSGHLPRLSDRPLVTDETIREAREGHERILTFRIALHSLCGRKQDVLDFAMQQSLAEELNYQPKDDLRSSERLLRDYFSAATAIHRLADTVIRRYREEQAIAAQDIERLRRRPVDGQFTRVGDLLYLARADALTGPDWLEVAFRGCLNASRLGVGLSQEIREGIRLRLPELGNQERSSPEAAKLFRALLQRRMNVASVLRIMRDVGLLGAYIPEFGQIQGLAINDILHDFTVDEHTLFALEYVDRLFLSTAFSDRFRREALDRMETPELLRLALLCHDLGKSRGGAGHSKRGALMIPALAVRLGLNEAETRALLLLVEHHLSLSNVSNRRDTGDGAVLNDLAAKVQTREMLDLLYLLTCADSTAVGQGSFPMWKDELLGELYLQLAAVLAPDEASPEAHRASLLEKLTATAATDAERDQAWVHCERVPPRYLVEVSVDEARLHLRLVARMKDEHREAAAAIQGVGDLVDVWVATTDRPRRFAQICGAFLGAGVNVVSAIAYTRSDGLILDHFRVSLSSAFGVPTGEPRGAFWERVAHDIEEALEGRGGFQEKLENARRRIPRVPLISRRVEPEVRLDNQVSERYTVIDVVCGDRIGLLYGLARAIGDLHCDIHFAKIDTQQGLATDVFYVSEVGGGQVLDMEKANNIRLLLHAVADEFQEARR